MDRDADIRMGERARRGKLPALWAAGRRAALAWLLGLGLAMGALTMLLAWLTGRLTSAFTVAGLWTVLGLALAFGLGKLAERVLAEKLGQHYVAQLRGGLLKQSLTADRAPGLGITVARSTNDLSSVRNWVIQGVVPLMAGIPLLLFALAGLYLSAPPLALALLIPLVLELLLLGALAPGAYGAARVLRRRRGALASRIAETLGAATAVRAAGGVEREVGRLQDTAAGMAAAAVHRARFAGALRASALAVPLMGSVLLVGVASSAALPASAVTSGLLLLGISSAVLGEFGRMVEYRQNYKAARRILAPLLAQVSGSGPGTGEATRLPAGAVGNAPDVVRLQPAPGQDAKRWPTLLAGPGERIAVGGGRSAQQLLHRLATTGLASDPPPHGAWVGGRNLGLIPERSRRRLLGAALSGMALERGPIARALRYRRPQGSLDEALRLAQLFGLEVDELPEAEATMLRRGGEPLDDAQRAGLLLARALLEEPALLVLDGLPGALAPSAAREAGRLLAGYPGVVLYRGTLPGLHPTRRWEPQERN
ncbi:ABC transporter ATP-binding protein [Glutamicibacter protophormiae]|uniref:ABC-type multidrug transport system fused ATPase/permease subunit n=1 Tax=Glutamicibacter protophormiae TaxID=37930 RepID=A0ABS4XPG2_GLUPR|nr:ABC transporter ATP-binding protein [Glutamicibacter protophormiae]MBP2398393.1 ABC-type multidrug transport system fused ATPase/permease subunit [Glutamicibacter protophormiae]GGL98743.1 ABC-type multidrug/protein/lipid transport system, ATPase [Glutamicibacter protophormiae]